MNTILMGLMALGFVVMLVMGLRANKAEKQVETRLQSLTMAAAPTKNMGFNRQKALETQSFNQRVLFPFAQRVFDKTQQVIPLSSKSWVKAKLIQAGLTDPQYPKIFLGIQLLMMAALGGGTFFLSLVLGRLPGLPGLLLTLFVTGVGMVFPLLWLVQQAGNRSKSIQKSLPDFLDLLVICVEAGLGLDAAISRICALKSVKTSTYLREELKRYSKDLNIGRSRKEALLDLGVRTGLEDFNTVVGALVQSYEMGTSVAHTLRVQSDTLRVKRLQQAEERANKIPVKMVLPIYIFLFPTIFLSIFGPMGMLMIKSVTAIMGSMKH
jgi:tight adherence protein C